VVQPFCPNAFKFTPKGGVIVLGGRIEGEDVQIFVRDNGPGIAPEVRASRLSNLLRQEQRRHNAAARASAWRWSTVSCNCTTAGWRSKRRRHAGALPPAAAHARAAAADAGRRAQEGVSELN